MIKINLGLDKNQASMNNLGGFDLTKVKLFPLIAFIGLLYLPDFVLLPMWETENEELNQQLISEQAKLSGIKRKLGKSVDIEKQIKELKVQEENLGKKLLAVKQAISEKKNPSNILLYIAKNIPDDLWIKELEITLESMTIKGESLDYASIGNFVNVLKSSVFIKDANIIGTSSNVRNSDKRRIESFEIKFTIARFEQ
jgi:Tfp pilus assembly protein PilN